MTNSLKYETFFHTVKLKKMTNDISQKKKHPLENVVYLSKGERHGSWRPWNSIIFIRTDKYGSVSESTDLKMSVSLHFIFKKPEIYKDCDCLCSWKWSGIHGSLTSSLYRPSVTAIRVLVGQLLELHQLCVVFLIRPLQIFHVLHHDLGGLAHTFLLWHNKKPVSVILDRYIYR